MLNVPCCPLCGNKDANLIERIDAKSLINIYKKKIEIDIKKYITSDIDYYHCNICSLGFFNPCPIGSAEFYEELQLNTWYYMDEKPEYDFALNFILNNVKGSVLEVGGGSGNFAKKIISKKIKYVGLEFNELAVHKANGVGIEMHRLDLSEYKDKFEEKHDCVVSFQVLEHISRPYDFLRDSLRCLKSNGFLIIAVPNKRGVAGLLPNIFLDLPPHHASHWTEDSLAYLKQLFNVEIVTINKERVAPQHIIAARKYLILQALAPKALAKNKLINNSLLFGLLNAISSILARILSINTNTLYGHTIIAVFKKIAD